MRQLPTVLLLACTACLVGRTLLKRTRGGDPVRAPMQQRVIERMLNAMPEDSPPKRIVSTLPRLQQQNEEIIALLKQQNEILRSTRGSTDSPDRVR